MDHEVSGQGRLKGDLHTLDGFGSLGKNITMSSGPITRWGAKRLQQTLQLFIQGWINEEDGFGSLKKTPQKKKISPSIQEHYSTFTSIQVEEEYKQEGKGNLHISDFFSQTC